MINFTTPGSLDIRAIKTFGLSSKGGQDKIGRFGTGLKYATAVIVRNGGTIKIQSDGETYEISSRKDEFRGTEIDQLTINGEDLPYTIALGKDWEVWMAFRELYSNTLDEGGTISHSDTPQQACGDETLISVELNAFEAIFYSMEEHFISPDEKPIWSSPDIEVHKGRSHFVFYRGIAVMKLVEPASFRYNLTGYIDLTEDRTAKYEWQVRNALAKCIAACDNDAVLHSAVDQRNSFEASLDFSSYEPSDAFLGSAVSSGNNCNPTAMALVKAKLPADKSEVTVISSAQPGGPQLMAALAILRRAGADLSESKFVLAEGMKFFGHYNVKNGMILLHPDIFNNQEAMTLAVFKGYVDSNEGDWAIETLIKLYSQEA